MFKRVLIIAVIIVLVIIVVMILLIRNQAGFLSQPIVSRVPVKQSPNNNTVPYRLTEKKYDVLNLSSYYLEEEGSVSFDADGKGVILEASEGASAWVVLPITLEGEANFMEVNIEWLSDSPAEGVLTFRFDTLFLLSFDERYTLESMNPWQLALRNAEAEKLLAEIMKNPDKNQVVDLESINQNAKPGQHAFSVRLDAFSGDVTKVRVSSVRPGLTYEE